MENLDLCVRKNFSYPPSLPGVACDNNVVCRNKEFFTPPPYTVFSEGPASDRCCSSVPGSYYVLPTTLLPDQKAPMVPLMRLLLC